MDYKEQKRSGYGKSGTSVDELSNARLPTSTIRHLISKLGFTGNRNYPGRVFLALLGLGIFFALYFIPFSTGSVDLLGNSSGLTKEGRGAIGILILAVIWWTGEVVPIGITAVALGVLQVLFAIRPNARVYSNYTDPSIIFIFGSIIIGLALTKSGLIKRVMYKLISVTGGRPETTLLGSMLGVAGLAHFMPHTAVAAGVFPILISVNDFYGEGSRPNNFGKSLFMGMAFAAGTGGIATMLGSARTPASLAMFREFIGNDISFFELSKYMVPVSWVMFFIIWGYLVLVLRTDRKQMEGLKESARGVCEQLGAITRDELTVAILCLSAAGAMFLQPFIPGLQFVDRTCILLVAVVLFFLCGVLTVRDLEDVPWNIILLYGGTISLSFCIWETGAARWMGLNIFLLLGQAHWAVFLLVATIIVLLLTNFIINVAVLAVCIPVLLVAAKSFGVHPEVVVFSCLAAAGMPFMLLSGAAPNAIAYESRQFSKREFLVHGTALSSLLIVLLIGAVTFIWP
jgi:solute carrier family 13 (sodium-dependent dicarboxylate transporter), member 2/3/5